MRLELQKLLPYRVFWIILGLFFAGIILTTALAFLISAVDFKHIQTSFQDFLTYPKVWANYAWVISISKNAFMFFLAIHTCNLFEYRILRQHLIDGLKPSEILMGFAFIIIIIASICTLSTALFGFLIGLPPKYFDYGFYFDSTSASYLAGVFLHCTVSFSFIILLATLFKRAGLTLFVWAFYAFIGERLIGWTMFQISKEPLEKYLPLKANSALIPYPPFFANPIADLPQIESFAWILSPIYGLLFFIAIGFKLRWSDH